MSKRRSSLLSALRRGLDWIDVSTGGVSPLQKIPVGPLYQVPFARAVREATGIRTIAVGLITTPDEADRVIRSGDADLIAIARAVLWDPRWPWHAAAELGATIKAPPQYWRCEPEVPSECSMVRPSGSASAFRR